MADASPTPQGHPLYKSCPDCGGSGWKNHVFSDPTPCKTCKTTGQVKKTKGFNW